jgi:hypothetical protein
MMVPGVHFPRTRDAGKLREVSESDQIRGAGGKSKLESVRMDVAAADPIRCCCARREKAA